MIDAQRVNRYAYREIAIVENETQKKKMTFAENAILTCKLLLFFGLTGMALWGINLWNAAK